MNKRKMQMGIMGSLIGVYSLVMSIALKSLQIGFLVLALIALTFFIDCFFYSQLSHAIKKWVNGYWIILCIFCLTISFIMIGAAYGNQPPSHNSPTTAIVLGAKVNKTQPSVSLQKRLEAALDYANKNPETNFIVSGGQGKGEESSESAVMKTWLIAHGVKESKIVEENQATNTGENLRYSLQLIHQLNLDDRVVLITDNYHQLRAQILAQQIGLQCYGVSAKTPLQLLPGYSVREWFGLIKALLLRK